MFYDMQNEELINVNGGHYPPSERDAVSTPQTEKEGRRLYNTIIWSAAGGFGGAPAALAAGAAAYLTYGI